MDQRRFESLYSDAEWEGMMPEKLPPKDGQDATGEDEDEPLDDDIVIIPCVPADGPRDPEDCSEAYHEEAPDGAESNGASEDGVSDDAEAYHEGGEDDAEAYHEEAPDGAESDGSSGEGPAQPSGETRIRTLEGAETRIRCLDPVDDGPKGPLGWLRGLFKRRRTKASGAADGTNGQEERRPSVEEPPPPHSFKARWERARLRRQGWVDLWVLSRQPNGDNLLEKNLVEPKDVPRNAVPVTGKKHTYAVDKIKDSEWYLETHDTSSMNYWEAQFTASDQCLYMMSNKLDNALTVHWNPEKQANNKKMMLLVLVAVICVAVFVLMRVI